MGRAAKQRKLNAREQAIAENYAGTGNVTLSARMAGEKSRQNAQHILAKPAVQETVRQIQERRIMSDLVPKALNLLDHFLTDKTAKPEVRIRAAQEVRQWSAQMGVSGADKPPEAMTPDELAARIAELRARQAQIMDAAKVIDGDDGIEDAQVIEGDDKPDIFG